MESIHLINLNVVQNYDRQDTSLISADLGDGRVCKHHMMLGEVRDLAFVADCILEQGYFS